MSSHRNERKRPTVLFAALGAAVVIAIGVFVGARSSNDNKSENAITDSSPGHTVDSASDPGVSHVHGLGINPADGSLIIATHFGSFRMTTEGASVQRIGTSYQDTMGFTVAGPDQFFGSGHPDRAGSAAGQPGRLGLIESTDGGVTWNPVSLSGEADFHSLAFSHGRIYGVDSGTGRFMVSSNQREWETRATIQLLGFAVDPDDAEHLFGTSPQGLLESVDGGRTWAASDGPPLSILSWDATAGLCGVDTAGGIWRRDEAEWAQQGELVGPPQAFLVTADVMYAAAEDNGTTGIYASTDQGQTWVLRYSD